MKRRAFLRNSSLVTLPVLVNGFKLGMLPRSLAFNGIDDESDRVLVLIQLDGGNDGLATLIPIDQYDTLANHRQGVVIPQQSVLPLYDHVGLHPAMEGFRELFDEGKLAAVQDVGYPEQNRSHFRSTDIWQTGSAADAFLTSGWLGRYFDNNYPGYPDEYPNEDYPDPFAITVQYTVSDTCQGSTSNYSMALTDPFTVGQIDEATIEQLPDNNFGNEMAFLINAIAQTNAYSETILEAANKGTNLSSLYDNSSSLAQQLRTVALLISGGLGTRVYIVRIGGFDTHANQVAPGSATSGTHANLLGQLSNAVRAFQDDLQKQNLENRVLGMTFSEFGRQIKSNDSLGTDHGNAAPLFLFGSCVQGGIVGDNPDIQADLAPQAGVEMQFDYRRVYATVLREWFGASENEVSELLYDEFTSLPIISECETTTSTDIPFLGTAVLGAKIFPNPAAGPANIAFQSPGGRVRIQLHDHIGRHLSTVVDGDFSQGEQVVNFNTGNLASGIYIITIRVKGTRESLKLIVP